MKTGSESWKCSVWRWLHGDLRAAFHCLKGKYRKAGEGLLTRMCSDRTSVNGLKLENGRLRLGIMKKFFIERVLKKG